MAPSFYDPNSADEQEVSLPSAPLLILSKNVVLQPPLTRSGSGPGMIMFLPPEGSFNRRTNLGRPLDPEPVQKWAEEGFAVVGATIPEEDANDGWSIPEVLTKGVEALLSLKELDVKDKFAINVYDPRILPLVIQAMSQDVRLACLVAFGSPPTNSPVPSSVHLPSGLQSPDKPPNITIHQYATGSLHFVLPQSADYNPGFASLAHSRILVFLRKILGAPIFDIEAIWEEHTYFEFEVRSVAKTMGTMVAEPYVNHIPTMAGGVGRKNLTEFYRDHFIFANPADTELQLVSRTVGSDRIIDEFVFKLTHDRVVDWLLPGVPPTGKKLEIPFVGVVNVRGDRLYHEHIWWDHASALLQVGVLPSHVPHGDKRLRLPIAGVEGARLLVDETDGTSNEMLGDSWGIQGA
ncbi:hypothetical protein V5O48_001094 [Marasmius crinis-equi]|uniref:Carboxymethylenebutenolidase n=1 Tax=Marasmius crinis-equi TaxID=585013 RepID=A0ABR3FZ99_9AGAR